MKKDTMKPITHFTKLGIEQLLVRLSESMRFEHSQVMEFTGTDPVEYQRFCRQLAKKNMIRNSGIPNKFINRETEWIEDEPTQDLVNVCRSYMKNFTANYTSGKSIILVGRVGVGKSDLMANFGMKLILDHHVCFRFFHGRDINFRLHNTSFSYENETQALVHNLETVDFLGLDDFAWGTWDKGKDGWRRMCLILDDRYRQKKPFIATMMFTPEDRISKVFGPEIWDRIYEMCDYGRNIVVSKCGESKRKNNL